MGCDRFVLKLDRSAFCIHISILLTIFKKEKTIMPASFIQIPIELINYVKAKKLSGLQYSLWLFLYSLDPFGDRFVPIPSPEAIASELNVCARRALLILE